MSEIEYVKQTRYINSVTYSSHLCVLALVTAAICTVHGVNCVCIYITFVTSWYLVKTS